MKRLLSVLFLCGLVVSGQAYGMSDSGKQKYLDWLKTISWSGTKGLKIVAHDRFGKSLSLYGE